MAQRIIFIVPNSPINRRSQNGIYRAVVINLTKTKKMTPKEKVEELVDKFNEHIDFDTNFKDETNKAKKRALICVKESIKIFDDTNGADYRLEYWQEVKQELNQNKEDEG